MTVKNYGVWLRYTSRTGIHNMYKEFRDVNRAGAVQQCYIDMAGQHKARFHSIHIIDVREVETKDLRRPNIIQVAKEDVKFPICSRKKKFRHKFMKRMPTTQ